MPTITHAEFAALVEAEAASRAADTALTGEIPPATIWFLADWGRDVGVLYMPDDLDIEEFLSSWVPHFLRQKHATAVGILTHRTVSLVEDIRAQRPFFAILIDPAEDTTHEVLELTLLGHNSATSIRWRLEHVEDDIEVGDPERHPTASSDLLDACHLRILRNVAQLN